MFYENTSSKERALSKRTAHSSSCSGCAALRRSIIDLGVVDPSAGNALICGRTQELPDFPFAQRHYCVTMVEGLQ